MMRALAHARLSKKLGLGGVAGLGGPARLARPATWLATLAACSAPSQPAPTPVAAPPPAASLETLAVAAPLDASVEATLPVDAGPLSVASAASAAGAGATVCSGAAIDLDAVLRAQACPRTPRSRASKAAEGGLAIRTEPADLRVALGGHLDFALVFASTTAEPQELAVFMGIPFRVEVYDPTGKRVDYVATCGHGSSLSGWGGFVSLAPGGTMTKALRVDATSVHERHVHDECKDLPPVPLAPGTYEIRVSAPVDRKPYNQVKLPLVVTN